MKLPKTKNGRPYISWSQIKSWKSAKSFNLQVKGKYEYIVSYFDGISFPDKGWGEFGHDVEGYITERKGVDKFNTSELETLDKIKPLGVFQQEGLLDMGDFDVLLYIDDMLPDMSLIRDYKTGSVSSLKQYEKPDYKQLHVYSAWIQQETGKLPKAEVLGIERKGNCMYVGGREKLSVGEKIITIPIEVTNQSIVTLKKEIVETALEIQDHWINYQLLKEIA